MRHNELGEIYQILKLDALWRVSGMPFMRNHKLTSYRVGRCIILLLRLSTAGSSAFILHGNDSSVDSSIIEASGGHAFRINSLSALENTSIGSRWRHLITKPLQASDFPAGSCLSKGLLIWLPQSNMADMMGPASEPDQYFQVVFHARAHKA